MRDDLRNLIKGLPIKVLSKNEVDIDGSWWHRSTLESLVNDTCTDSALRLGYRVILALMDKFEEPKKPEVGGSAPPYCVEHNCQMILSVYNRPGSPPGNGWSCPECSKEREPKPAPTWEPGTVLVNKDNIDGWRLDQNMGNLFWSATSMSTGKTFDLQFLPEEWTVQRLPHEFKVGDWFLHNENPRPSRCAEVDDAGCPISAEGVLFDPACCRHVPAPRKEEPESETDIFVPMPPKSERPVTMKVKREDPFQGPHWFSEVNKKRCESPDGFNHKLNSWTTSDWITAVVGELGEAANNAKKLNRVRDGIPGNKEESDSLRDKLRKELGDTYVYLDLLCQSLGFYALDAAIEVFDEKSRQISYPCDLRDEVRRLRDNPPSIIPPPTKQKGKQ